MIDSTFSGNHATYGGAIWTGGSTMTLNTCTLAGNSATGTSGEGGAIFDSGPLTLSAITVADNSAPSGGGIFVVNGNPIVLMDTIVAGNTPTSSSGMDPDIDGSVATSSSYNLIGNGAGLSGISNGVNHNKIGTSSAPINPLLGPLGNNGGPTETMAVLPGSPAISSGGSMTTLTSAITAGSTVISVADAAAIASPGSEANIRIDGETLVVWSVNLTNNTLTVSPVSAATSHSAGAGVYLAYDQRGTTAPDSPAIGAYQLVAGPAVSLTVSGPTSSGEIAGVPFNVTITADDASGNTATGDNAGVTLTSTDSQSVIAAPVMLFNGSATVSVVLDKADNTTLKASSNSITGTSSPFTVSGAAAASFSLSAPSTMTAGAGFNLKVTALDAFGNVATKYGGTATLTSSGGQTVFPNTVSFGSFGETPGVATVTAVLDKVGTMTLTATAGSVKGTSTSITVIPAAAASFALAHPAA